MFIQPFNLNNERLYLESLFYWVFGIIKRQIGRRKRLKPYCLSDASQKYAFYSTLITSSKQTEFF